MEDKKKKFPPRKEGGHKEGERKDGDRRDGDRRDGGQRISVRPGNFNPPPRQKGNAPASAPVTNAERREPAAGGEHRNQPFAGERRSNHQGRNGRDNHRNENRNKNAAEQQKTPTAPVAESPDNGVRNQRNNRNRRHGDDRRRGENRRNEQSNPPAPELSSSLQKALDEEFNTPAFSATAELFRKDPKKEEIAVDSEEFAVDIATAAYLLDDIPCGFPIPDGKAVEVVGVRFRHAGKIYFFAPGKDVYRIGDEVLVDTARGPELGEIVMLKRRIAEKDVIQPLRAVLRHATEQDKLHERENRAKEGEALKICADKIVAHKLDMKLVDAQYTFDNSKLLFYFTSEGRVDFRELVRDLAGVFHTRIELRQIGIRDESRLIGGLGMCGRPFCCSTFLSDFGQVSIKMAKEQGLSINTSKISGCCGRLMCCLRYEHETYAEEIRLTPKKDSLVDTPDGSGVVLEATPLAGTVKVRLDNAPEEAPRVYHRDTVTVTGKEKRFSREKAENGAKKATAAPAKGDQGAEEKE